MNSAALRAIITSYRDLADQLEALLGDTGQVDPQAVPTPRTLNAASPPVAPGQVFDPERDRPRLTPDPHGDLREQLDWCGLVFFGRLRAINVREGRGATPSERTAIARAAGYQDARGYAGWSWTWKDLEDGRWITDEDDLSEEDKAKGRWSGMRFLRHYAETLSVRLPDDLV